MDFGIKKVSVFLFFTYISCFFLFTGATDRKWWIKLAQKQGPMVCPEEQVLENERYFSTPWTGGNLCGKETIIRFSCCHGYARVPGERGCPLVKPLKNVADTAAQFGAKEFIRQADISGLLPLLSDRGAYTVFAARDAAFQSLTKEEEKALNSSRRSRSRPPLLLYTVAEGRILAEDLPDSLTTLYREGSIVVTKFPNGLITVNCIPLIATNLEATNGLIHITESLLLPTGRTTITDLLVRSQNLSTTATAIARAQLSNELRDRKPITIFAPVDQAWESLPQSFMEALMEDTSSLKVLLQYHIVESVWCSAVSGSGNKMVTLEGGTIEVSCNGTGQYVNNAHIINSDHTAGNGFVHHIDAVLIPEKVRSLAELLQFHKVSYFLKLAEVAGLLPLLQQQGALTIFAPTDAAFELLPNDTLSALLEDTNLARSIMSFHITPGRHLTSNFIDGQKLPTLGSDAQLRIKMHTQRVTVETALVNEADKQTRNGILHFINDVLFPPKLSIAELLKEENFSSFVNLLNKTEPNLLKALDNTSASFTIFAPNNIAMNNTSPGMISRLGVDPPLLFKRMSHHIIKNFVVTNTLETTLTYSYETLSGNFITLKKENGDTVTVAGLAEITKADRSSTNGVIHEVSRFIEF